MVNEVRGYENTTIQSTANWLAEDRYDPDWEQVTDDIIQEVSDHAKIPNIEKQNLARDENGASAADVLVVLRTFHSWCETHQEFKKNDFNFFKKWENLAKNHFT